jgi:hypothetical protein
MAQLGSGEVVTEAYDMTKKKMVNVSAKQANTPYSFVTGAIAPDGTAPFPSGPRAGDRVPMRQIYATAFPNIDTAWVEGLQMWQSARSFVLKAELVIVGDPLLEPGWSVHIAVQTYRIDEDGNVFRRLHYTSGIWLIYEVRHVIQGGQYLSFLQVHRNDAFEGASPTNEDGQPVAGSAARGVLESSNTQFLDNFPNNEILR